MPRTCTLREHQTVHATFLDAHGRPAGELTGERRAVLQAAACWLRSGYEVRIRPEVPQPPEPSPPGSRNPCLEIELPDRDEEQFASACPPAASPHPHGEGPWALGIFFGLLCEGGACRLCRVIDRNMSASHAFSDASLYYRYEEYPDVQQAIARVAKIIGGRPYDFEVL